MKAINHFVIVDKIKEAPKKVGGLELTEKQNKDVRYIKGKVISVGDQVSELVSKDDIIRYEDDYERAGWNEDHDGHMVDNDDIWN